MKRIFWFAVLGILVAVASTALFYRTRGPHGGAPTPVAAVTPPPQAAKPAAPTPSAPRAPSFDAVRVGPDGHAVIAGRAAPGAEVTVLDRGEPVGHATADANGEWVVLTDKPLPSGAQELSLSAQGTGETAPVASTSHLAVIVPEHGTQEPSVAVVLPQGEGAARTIGGLSARAPHQVALDIVEYDGTGHVLLTGRAEPGAAIAISIADRHLGDATADPQGNWTADLSQGVPVGRYRLRLKARAHDGQDAGDIVLELRRAAPGEFGSGAYLAVVPGNSLWHLARHSYGDGLRYVELYRANLETVENPDRIFPGQLLALPAKR